MKSHSIFKKSVMYFKYNCHVNNSHRSTAMGRELKPGHRIESGPSNHCVTQA